MKFRRSWAEELIAFFGRRQRGQITSLALEQTLRQVARSLPDLRWAAVVSPDGLLHMMYDPFGREKIDRASAMAAAGFSLGERISKELRLGRLVYSVIAGEEGLFLLHSIAGMYVLALSLPAGSDVGAAMGALAQAADTLMPAPNHA
jgi:predicted regulator of Ras-like GTPase activity (Roadblock/LC7/MglB family)